jgi:hypothetical protein
MLWINRRFFENELNEVGFRRTSFGLLLRAVGSVRQPQTLGQLKEQTHVVVRDCHVAERLIRVQVVMLAAVVELGGGIACCFAICYNAFHGLLGDPKSGCDFTQSKLGLRRDAKTKTPPRLLGNVWSGSAALQRN